MEPAGPAAPSATPVHRAVDNVCPHRDQAHLRTLVIGSFTSAKIFGSGGDGAHERCYCHDKYFVLTNNRHGIAAVEKDGSP